jgi:hypothetical protein
VPIFLQSGSLDLLEPSGPVQASNGITLPYSGDPLNLQMSETHILVRLLQMYFPRNWKFGLTLSFIHSFNPYKFITNLKDMEHVNISNAI